MRLESVIRLKPESSAKPGSARLQIVLNRTKQVQAKRGEFARFYPSESRPFNGHGESKLKNPVLLLADRVGRLTGSSVGTVVCAP